MSIEITINEAQDKRKEGYWLLVNKQMTKVLALSKSKKDITSKYKRSKNLVFSPLKKIIITTQDIKESDYMYKNGLMCNI